jgi:urea transport system substrate-binding protein
VASSVSLTLPSDLLLRGPRAGSVSVGLLVPVSGVMGVAGPSILNCAVLAAEEVNEHTDTPIELVLIDAGRAAGDVAREVDLLVGAGLVEGLVGTHTSNVRAAVEAVLADRVPYVFTPPHEMSHEESSSIFLGSDPDEQLRQPLAWISRHRRATRWVLIGNDYVWPRKVHSAARRVLRELGQTVVMERLVPIGKVDVAELIAAATAAKADAILVSLVGRDGIEFHRGVTGLNAGGRFLRLCTALDENCLVAAGGDDTGQLFAAMPSFILQSDDRHDRLLEAYVARFGLQAPAPGSYAEGCYDGVHLIATLCLSGLLASRSAATAAEWLLADGGAASVAMGGRKSMSMARANGTDLEVVVGAANL